MKLTPKQVELLVAYRDGKPRRDVSRKWRTMTVALAKAGMLTPQVAGEAWDPQVTPEGLALLNKRGFYQRVSYDNY